MLRILVIDDEGSIRKFLKTVLTRKRHDVLLAQSGQRGIDFRADAPPCHHSGSTYARCEWSGGLGPSAAHRSSRRRDHTDRLSTGYLTDEKLALARTLGVNEFLKKGFSLFELGEALKRVMAGTGMHPVPALGGGTWNR